MDMDLTLLATLKDKLIHARNFTKVWEYFMDHFGEDPDFIALGDATHDPFLEAVLSHVAKGLFGRQVSSADFLLTRLPEHQFLHGGGTLNGRLANVLYFEDIRMGLLAVVTSVQPSETKMVRFSGRPMPANWNPSQN
jgi:hypothetical protein